MRFRSPRAVSGSLDPVRDLALSMAHPFDYSSCIPDGANGTGCFSLKQIVQLNTGATGTCCALFQSIYTDSFQIVDSGNNATTITIPANWAQAQANTTVFGIYRKYRPVSCGVRVNYIGPTTSDSGTLLIGQVAGVPASGFSTTTLQTAANGCQTFRVYPVRNGGSITWTPGDIEDQADFIGVGVANIPTTSLLHAPYIVVAVFGAASAQGCISVETIVNYEGQYSNQNFMSGGSSNQPRPSAMGWYERAKQLLTNVERITPFVQSAANFGKAVMPVIGTLANGYMSPSRLGSSVPPLLRVTY